MKAFLPLLALVTLGSAAITQQRQTTQIEDDSNWGDLPAAPAQPAAPASIGILPGQAIVPSRVVYVTAHNAARAPAVSSQGIKGGSRDVSHGGHSSGDGHGHNAQQAPPRQFVQSVATPLGLQCYLNNPNALQGLLAPPVGQPQLVAVYDQPGSGAGALPEAPVADQAVKSPAAGSWAQDQSRKSRYPSRSQSGSGSLPAPLPARPVQPAQPINDDKWFVNTQQQRQPVQSQAKGYRQVSVVY